MKKSVLLSSLAIMMVSGLGAFYTRNAISQSSSSVILLEDIEAKTSLTDFWDTFTFYFSSSTYWRYNHHSETGTFVRYETFQGKMAEILPKAESFKSGHQNAKYTSYDVINAEKDIWKIVVAYSVVGTLHSFSWTETAQETIWKEAGCDVNLHLKSSECSEYYQNEPDVFKNC